MSNPSRPSSFLFAAEKRENRSAANETANDSPIQIAFVGF
jgi:hypothetical protein